MAEYPPTATEKLLKEAKEKLVEKRKIASEKLGRFASGVLFNARLSRLGYKDGDLTDDELTILHEQNYQDGREKREHLKDRSIYYTRRLGAYAMMVPGVGVGVDKIKASGSSFIWEHRRAAAKRSEYKKEHGTFMSKTKKHIERSKNKLSS